MKPLFDANLSPKLVVRLAELFPGSAHVFHSGLGDHTPDDVIWKYCGANGFTIVTADSDFLDLAEKYGPPPAVVRLENCNYRTTGVERLLRRNAVRITELERAGGSVLIVKNAD